MPAFGMSNVERSHGAPRPSFGKIDVVSARLSSTHIAKLHSRQQLSMQSMCVAVESKVQFQRTHRGLLTFTCWHHIIGSFPRALEDDDVAIFSPASTIPHKKASCAEASRFLDSCNVQIQITIAFMLDKIIALNEALPPKETPPHLEVPLQRRAHRPPQRMRTMLVVRGVS